MNTLYTKLSTVERRWQGEMKRQLSSLAAKAQLPRREGWEWEGEGASLTKIILRKIETFHAC